MFKFNECLNRIDLSPLISHFIEKGESVEYLKGERFITQGDYSNKAGYVVSGLFRYTKTDELGGLNTVGLSFEGDFVTDYPSFIHQSDSLTTCEAVTDSTLFLITHEELSKFWNSSIENERLGRRVAEEIFVDTYKRLLDFYCATPKQRYETLLRRLPQLPNLIPQKEIASYIGVTPETLSRIKKMITEENRS